MFSIEIPGYGSFPVRHLVLDLNGTLALDGEMIPGVKERLGRLAGKFDIHILTADTHGRAPEVSHDLPVTLHIIPEKNQFEAKREYLRGLPLRSIAIGNGRNDAGMLAEAALGIAVIGPEGASPEAVHAADVMVLDINDGLDLLLYPDRLKATLRS